MSLTCGIVGLPNVGKSTVFNALAGAHAEASNYPFCTVEPNRGRATVPDERLEILRERFKPEKVTPATIEFLDVAGLVEGASRGEGLGNAFLGHLRSVDAIVHVVRMFEDSDIAHIIGDCDPVRDIELVQTELIISDLQIVERRQEKVRRVARTGQKEAVEELEQLSSIHEVLSRGVPLLSLVGNDDHGLEGVLQGCKEWGLLTDRPVLYLLNLGEDQIPLQDRIIHDVKERLGIRDVPVLPISARLENEIMDLEPRERESFREEMNWGSSGLERLVEDGFRLLDLITFYTVVGAVVTAWTLPRGASVFQAAGRIHSDMQKGFVKAEVIHFDDFLQAGSEEKVRQLGLMHVEGRDYPVQDRDILKIRFH